MPDELEAFRRHADEALKTEDLARRTISAVMGAYLGGVVSVGTSHHVPAGGFTFFSWTDNDRKRGLLIRQVQDGTHVAVDLERNTEIGKGDGLTGLCEAVVKHFMAHRPK